VFAAAAVAVLVTVVVATATWGFSGVPGSDDPPASRSSTAPPDITPPPTGARTPPSATFTVTATPGVPAGSETRPQRPRTVMLPSGTEVPVRLAPTGGQGLLQVPDDITEAGWWTGGSRLGDSYGAMVLASHVDSTTQGLGPFAELLAVAAGDEVVVASDGLRQAFTVQSVDVVPKAELDTRDSTFATDGPLRLVLITCAGPYEPDLGGYQNLAIVTAVPSGPLEG